jgi:TrmH family RNA methyltransferase
VLDPDPREALIFASVPKLVRDLACPRRGGTMLRFRHAGECSGSSGALRDVGRKLLRAMITSSANPRLKLIRRLESRRQRAKLGLFACEGEDLVDAAVAAGIEPVDLLVAGEDVAPELLGSVSTLAHPPRVVGVFRRADLPSWVAGSAVLALWHVADPGNVGTLIRTADAFGASVALSEGCADPTGPKAVRGSAGAIFRVPLGRYGQAGEGWRVALTAHEGEPLDRVELAERTVFVLGAEREGLPDDVTASCDVAASIPLAAGAESLNVAVAGAIALYEWRRRL